MGALLIVLSLPCLIVGGGGWSGRSITCALCDQGPDISNQPDELGFADAPRKSRYGRLKAFHDPGAGLKDGLADIRFVGLDLSVPGDLHLTAKQIVQVGGQ